MHQASSDSPCGYGSCKGRKGAPWAVVGQKPEQRTNQGHAGYDGGQGRSNCPQTCLEGRADLAEPKEERYAVRCPALEYGTEKLLTPSIRERRQIKGRAGGQSTKEN